MSEENKQTQAAAPTETEIAGAGWYIRLERNLNGYERSLRARNQDGTHLCIYDARRITASNVQVMGAYVRVDFETGATEQYIQIGKEGIDIGDFAAKLADLVDYARAMP